MPLPAFKTKDEIPEAFRGEYEERDGEWKPKEDEGLAGAKSALATERTKREAAEGLAKKAADELKKLETKAKAAGHKLSDDEYATLREEASREERTARETAETALATERAERRQEKIGSQFKSLAGEKKFLGGKLGDLERLHANEFDLTDDGKLMVKGKPGIDPVKHMESIAKLRPEWVEGTKAGGGGAAGMTSGGTAAGTLTAEQVLANPGLAFG